MNNSDNVIKNEHRSIIANYGFDNCFKEDLKQKRIVLSYISKAIKKELDDESIDFIIKKFISKNASIHDFDDNTLNNVLVIIYTYIDTHFQITAAMSLNNVKANYRPRINFDGVRYEGFDLTKKDKGKQKKENNSKIVKPDHEPHGWVRGRLPVDTKKERM